MSNEVHDLEIAAHDSIYIFVEVTIDPSGQNQPMVVKDSIEFSTNLNLQDIDLLAWGQDFNLIRNELIKTTTCTNEKPYLIYNNAVVDSLATLTIEPGTKIYFHKDAGLFAKGNIKANGTFSSPIIFQGDRLESVYSDVPDQWRGILLFSGSQSNEFNFVEIKNANIGLQVGTIEDEGYASANLANTKIQNMAYAGIFAMKSEIEAYNCLVTNCGFYLAALTVGGSYEFNHSTFANYWGKFATKVRNTSSVVISNVLIIDEKTTYAGDLNKAKFGNCIITGDVGHENEIEIGQTPEAEFNYQFDHCILQLADTFKTDNTEHFVEILKGIDPKFIDPYEKYNFELDTLSPAKDVAKLQTATLFPVDLKNNSRLDDDGPDLGAFERIEKKEE